MPDRPYGLGSRGQGLLPPGSRPNPNRDIPDITPALGCQRRRRGADQRRTPCRRRGRSRSSWNGAGAPTYRVPVAGAPGRPGKVAALAQAPPPRTVVWLDGLRRCLDGEYGPTGGVVRALLNAPNPVVIIGTLWPDLCTAYTAVPVRGGADPRAGTRTAGPGCSRPHRPGVQPGGAGPGPRRCGPRSAVADGPARSRLSTASSARRPPAASGPAPGHLQQAGAAGAVSDPARRDPPPQAAASRTSASPARSRSSLPSSPASTSSRLSRSKIVNRSWWRLVATKLVRVPSWAGWRGGYGGRGAGGVRECAARPPCRAAAFSA